jgi:hypothetical protein
MHSSVVMKHVMQERTELEDRLAHGNHELSITVVQLTSKQQIDTLNSARDNTSTLERKRTTELLKVTKPRVIE